MGKTCDLSPPSEALPDIGLHCVVFHNGKGFYYTCKDYQYSSSPKTKTRLFACLRPECKVTASMGPGLGSPLIDQGIHSHSPDLDYRDKCILLNTIRQRFLHDCSPAVSILQEVVSSISLMENEIAFASCDFDPTIEEEKPPVSFIKEEPVDVVVDTITEEDSHMLLESSKPAAVILQGDSVLFPESYFIDTTNQKTCSSPEPSTSHCDPLNVDVAEVNQDQEDQVENCLYIPNLEDICRRKAQKMDSKKKVKFRVVEFQFGGGVHLVANSWLTNSEKKCKWPNSTNQNDINKAVATQETPTSNWSTMEVAKIHYATNDYETGMQKLKLLEKRVSDIDSDDGGPKKKRRITKSKKCCNTSDSESNFCDDDLSQLEEFPSSPEENLLSTKEFQRECLQKLSLILHEVKSINTRLLALENQGKSEQENDLEEISLTKDLFPIESEQQMIELENKLEDELYVKSCVKVLSIIGGHDKQSVIVNVLKKILMNGLAEQYSLLGAKQKKPFKKLHIYRVILDTVRYHYKDLTTVEVNDVIARWLVQSKSRRLREEEKLSVIRDLLPPPPSVVESLVQKQKRKQSHTICKILERDASNRLKRKECKSCNVAKKRTMTTFICESCPDKPGLCPGDCFNKYHDAL